MDLLSKTKPRNLDFEKNKTGHKHFGFTTSLKIKSIHRNYKMNLLSKRNLETSILKKMTNLHLRDSDQPDLSRDA